MIITTIAMVFPGQGSQTVGMLDGWASYEPILRRYFVQASERLNVDLWSLVQQGPVEQLNQTIYTQPAMYCSGYGLYRIYQQQGLPPARYLVGHSLGELTALACAGAMSFSDGLDIVIKRAQLMQQAVAEDLGAMAAIIGLTLEKVLAICQMHNHATQFVAPANYNTLEQVVISGHRSAVLEAMNSAKAQGAKIVKLLPLSIPSHCPLMSEAAQAFADYLQAFNFMPPQIPVLSNVDATWYTDVQDMKHKLAEQLHQPVRWLECITYLYEQSVRTFVECGPGNVLTGLIKRSFRDTQPMTLAAAIDSTDLMEARYV